MSVMRWPDWVDAGWTGGAPIVDLISSLQERLLTFLRSERTSEMEP